MAFNKTSLSGVVSTIKEGWEFFNSLIDDLVSTSAGKGASQIGIEDAAEYFEATDVESALAEEHASVIPTVALADFFNKDDSITTGLTWGYKPGRIRFYNIVMDVATGTIGLIDDAVNYIEIQSNGTITRNDVGFNETMIPLRQITTSGGAITESLDRRAWFSGTSGVLASQDDLDGVPDGTTYSRLLTTAITAGRITLTSGLGVSGILPESYTIADVTADNAQKVSWLSDAGDLATQDNIINGANLCPNSGFVSGLTDWTFSTGTLDDTNITDGVDYNAASTLYQGHTFYIQQTDIQSDEDLYCYEFSVPIPVEVDKYYCVSAYTGANKCKVIIYISFYDVDDNFLSSSAFASENTNDTDGLGGEILSGYKRIYSFDQAPATTSYCRVVFRKYDTNTGEANSYLFASNAMLSEVGSEQTVPPAYQPYGTQTATQDDLADGATYGRVALTAISAGLIVLTTGVSGSLPVANSDAKCTDADADQTSANAQASG